MLASVVRQSVDKLLEIIDSTDITNKSVSSTKELGQGTAIISCWGITHDSVSDDKFIGMGMSKMGL